MYKLTKQPLSIATNAMSTTRKYLYIQEPDYDKNLGAKISTECKNPGSKYESY